MKHTKTSPVIFLLVIAALLLPVSGYLFWNFSGILPVVGSVTDHATVRSYRVGSTTLYSYTIRNDSEILESSELSEYIPYLWEKDGHVLLREMDGGEVYLYDYDLTTGSMTGCDSMPLFMNPFSTLEKNRPVPIETGVSNVKFYEISDQGKTRWYWEAEDSDGKTAWDWCGESETKPEASENETRFTVFFTEEGMPLCREFDLESGVCSHDFSLYEDGRVYVEQAIGSMPPYLYPDDSVLSARYVNTEPTEIEGCNDAYQIAKNEVTIPYDLVTFCGNVNIQECMIDRWAVCFFFFFKPDAAVQTVYMDGHGVTLWVSEERPS